MMIICYQIKKLPGWRNYRYITGNLQTLDITYMYVTKSTSYRVFAIELQKNISIFMVFIDAFDR